MSDALADHRPEVIPIIRRPSIAKMIFLVPEQSQRQEQLYHGHACRKRSAPGEPLGLKEQVAARQGCLHEDRYGQDLRAPPSAWNAMGIPEISLDTQTVLYIIRALYKEIIMKEK
jgi:hypothetical protein